MGHFIPPSHHYTAFTVSQAFLDNIYKLHGLPKLIVSDMDTFFLSRFWKELFQVSLHMSLTYHPQTDRHTKVDNRSIEFYLRSLAAREAAIDLLKFHLKRAQNRMKMVADKRRIEREFIYYGMFRILAKVGKVAYKLELPDNAQIHPVFHVSQLKAHRRETPLSPGNLPHYNNEG
ncbi:retrotransposable element Tf2 [Tanacetum coccineum]